MIWLLFFNSGCGIGTVVFHLMEDSLFFFSTSQMTLGQANMARHGISFSQLNLFFIARYANWLIVEERILDPNDECSSDCTILKPQPGTAASLVSVNAAAWPWMNQLRMAVSIGKMKMRVGAIKNFGSLFCPIFRAIWGCCMEIQDYDLKTHMGATSLMFEHLDYGLPFTREIASQSAMDISASHLIAEHLQAHLSV